MNKIAPQPEECHHRDLLEILESEGDQEGMLKEQNKCLWWLTSFRKTTLELPVHPAELDDMYYFSRGLLLLKRTEVLKSITSLSSFLHLGRLHRLVDTQVAH